MEQKTAEETLREKQVEYNKSIGKSENNMNDEEWKETLADPVFQSLVKAMQAYAKQQQEIAVDKALEIASEKSEITTIDNPNYDGCFTTTSCSCIKYMEIVDKQSILSLKPEILKELEK